MRPSIPLDWNSAVFQSIFIEWPQLAHKWSSKCHVIFVRGDSAFSEWLIVYWTNTDLTDFAFRY